MMQEAEEKDLVDFGTALDALKDGATIKRKHWGKDEVIGYYPGINEIYGMFPTLTWDHILADDWEIIE